MTDTKLIPFGALSHSSHGTGNGVRKNEKMVALDRDWHFHVCLFSNNQH
jgi:hypothetical protein